VDCGHAPASALPLDHAHALHQRLHDLALDLPGERAVEDVAQLAQQLGGTAQSILRPRRVLRVGFQARQLDPQAALLAIDVVQLTIERCLVDATTTEQTDDRIALTGHRAQQRRHLRNRLAYPVRVGRLLPQLRRQLIKR
jgi:hypothetical protein